MIPMATTPTFIRLAGLCSLPMIPTARLNQVRINAVADRPAGVAYQFRPTLSATVDVQNIFNEPQCWYRGVPDQLAQVYVPGVTMTFGVSGRS